MHVWEARPSYDNLLALVLAIAVAILLRGLLYVSRTGVAMRAVVDNPTLAALNGAPPNTIRADGFAVARTDVDPASAFPCDVRDEQQVLRHVRAQQVVV